MYRIKLGINIDDTVIGIIGRLVIEKGYQEYLEAACKISRLYPKVIFIIIGERLESDHAGSVAKQLTDVQDLLGSRLKILGMREDIPELLAAMDIFCLPSYREGMPRTIIEAMMMEKPVIATDIRGSREEVISGKTGILVPSKNTDRLITAMSILLDDKDLARSMGRAGRKRALAEYNEDNIIDKQINKIIDLYKQKTAGSILSKDHINK